MIPQNAYEAWLALTRLAPLLFQNKIEDIEIYKVNTNTLLTTCMRRRVANHYLQKHLTLAIEDFLRTAALWNTQWFNKPKFHLFVHILDHILRFGPASLYSTEAFESYNYVIHLRSINSNKARTKSGHRTVL